MSADAGQLSLMPNYAPEHFEDLAQWFTPPKLANRIATAFVEPGARVFEPTAGRGALVKASLRKGAAIVDAVELDSRWFQKLELLAKTGAPVRARNDDFLSLRSGVDGYDVRGATCVSNFPDSKKDGIIVADFLAKAARDVGPDGKVVSLIRLNVLNGVNTHKHVWSRAQMHNVVYLSRRPAFAASAGQQEWCVVRFSFPNKSPGVQRPVTEWWADSWN